MSIVFGAAMMVLVVAIFHRPAVFPDTMGYMDNGANVYRAAARLLHIIPPPKPVSAAIGFQRRVAKSYDLTLMESRSPWYGVFARPLEWAGTIWLLAAVQAAVAAWLIWLCWRAITPGAPTWTAFAAQGVTAAFSTLPFIASFAMPDVFVSFMIVAVTLLLVAWDRLAVYERTILALLAAYSTTVHGANALLAGAMVAVAAAFALPGLAGRKALAVPLYVVILTLSGGLTAGAVSNIAINLIDRQAPGRPAFLAFRLIADGPGRAYLRQVCAHASPYLLCQHKDKPMDDSQGMLWSSDPKVGIFSFTQAPEHITMQHEELRFVLGVVRYDPIGAAKSVIKNWWTQFGMVTAEAPLVDQRMYLGRPNLYPYELPRTPELFIATWDTRAYRQSALPRMVERAGDCIASPERCRARLTFQAAHRLQDTEFWLALAAMAALCVASIRRGADDPWLRAAGLITFAVVANALLCGAISGPFPRYQSCVAWLPVMMASIGCAALVAQRVRAPAARFHVSPKEQAETA